MHTSNTQNIVQEDVEMRDHNQTKPSQDVFENSITKRSLMDQFYEADPDPPSLQNFINFSDSDEEPANNDEINPFTNIANTMEKPSERPVRTGPPPMHTTRQFSFSQSLVDQNQSNSWFGAVNLDEEKWEYNPAEVTCKRNLFGDENENIDPNQDTGMSSHYHRLI